MLKIRVSWGIALAMFAACTFAAVNYAPAQAAGCPPGWSWQFNASTMTYGCTKVSQGGSPGSPGGGGGTSKPTCTLTPPATFCKGTIPCYTRPDLPPVALPPGKRPTPDAQALVDWCISGGTISPGKPYWSTKPQPPSLYEQAMELIGRLQLDMPALKTSPAGRTLVNLPTWYWIQPGPDGGTVPGGKVFDLTLVATAKSVTIDTGDGNTTTCPWTDSSAQAQNSCTYTYRAPSTGGTATVDGHPAYQVSATITWSLEFQQNGVHVDIPDVPATIDRPAATTPLRVAESKTLVTGVN